MSETILWLYDLTAMQTEEAKAVLRALLRPTNQDTVLLHTTELADRSKRFDICLQLSQDADFAADVVSVLARTLQTPFECTHLDDVSSLWRFTPSLGLHHVHLDSFGTAVLSEALLQEAIAVSRGNGIVLAGKIRKALGSHLDDELEGFRLRTGGAQSREISIAS